MLSRNSRIGMKLFVVYLLFYSGYVLINAVAPQMMERTPLAGVNLAIWYGMALILGAFGLAVLYGLLCRPEDDRHSSSRSSQEEQE
jgi:uncharacterized membrane protein (DUF485 family)